MRIVDTTPDEVISAWRYQGDMEDGAFYPLDYLQENIGSTVCARLVVHRYGDDHEYDHAGNFSVNVESIVAPKRSKLIQPGVMKVTLTAAESEGVKPSKFFVSPSGIIQSRSRILKLVRDEGYFPIHTTSYEDAAAHLLTGSMPPTGPDSNVLPLEPSQVLQLTH
jgi:hypothetical protein